MKRILKLFLVCALGAAALSCTKGYDDTAIKNDVENIKNDINKIKEDIKSLYHPKKFAFLFLVNFFSFL